MSESKTSVRRLQAVSKQAQALAMRTAGSTFGEIAACLGYASASGALKAVETALRKTLQEPADTLRQLERERLDRLQQAVWMKAVCGDQQAVAIALRISESRRKLMGLDAPLKLEVDISLVIAVVDATRAAGIEPAELFNNILLELAAGHTP